MAADNETPENKKEEVNKTNVHSTGANHATPLLITIAVLLVLIVLGGAFAAGHRWSRTYNGPMLYGRQSMMGEPEFGAHRMGSYMNTSGRVIGVVTKVNGEHFTVASNGATKDVLTNSSTQYEGGSSVSLNDSVIVLGSTSNNQFTADSIVINP